MLNWGIGIVAILMVATLVSAPFTRKWWNRPTWPQFWLSAAALTVALILLIGAGINSALHPSAQPLLHTLTSVPVPPGAKVVISNATDGDIDSQAEANLEYALPNAAQDECVAALRLLLAGNYVVHPAGSRTPISSASAYCAGINFTARTDSASGNGAQLDVCLSAAVNSKCFEEDVYVTDETDAILGTGNARSTINLSMDGS